MVKVEKYESIHGGLVDLGQGENAESLDLSEAVPPFFCQSRATVHRIITRYDGERKKLVL